MNDEPTDSTGSPTATRVLAEMGWSLRVARVFAAMGLVTIGDLLKKKASDFEGLANFGPKSLREIRTTLTAMGLELTEDGGQRTEVRSQKSEDRGQGEEIRNQKSEIRGQGAEDRAAPLFNQQSPINNQQSPITPTNGTNGSHGTDTKKAGAAMAAIHGEAAPMPEMLMYRTRVGERWRCEKFALLAAEYLKVGETDYVALMTFFHEVACRFPRSWFIVRRLFGVSPVVLPVDASTDDYLPMSRPMIMDAMGLTPEQLTAELDALRAVWINARESSERDSVQALERDAPPTLPRSDAPDASDAPDGTATLHEFGFDESAFDLQGRTPELNARERAWFVIRVEHFRKTLMEPMVADLARQILVNELTLRRLEYELMGKMVGTAEWRRSADAKRELERLYLEQLSNLDDIYPWKSSIGGKVTFKGCVSEMFLAKQQYYANGDTRLVDKIRTAAEVDIDFRQSVQSPEPRYRYGQNLYLIEAIDPRNLWDPNFSSQFKYRTLKKVDQIGKMAIDQGRRLLGEELPDLMSEEYPDSGAEGRGQRTEVRSQRTDGQMTEVRGQKSEDR